MPTKARQRMRAGEPWLVDRADRRVAVVRTTGEPGAAAATAIPALYRAVYRLKMARKRAGADFKVEPVRARWPNAHTAPKHEWVGLWALPVPDDVDAVESPDAEIAVETWTYGPTAEIVHHGDYESEGATVARLHAFVAELGYELAGPHEEEYLSRPGAADQRTVIRYPVRSRR